ncbi:MAG: hypothetical protein ACXADY_14510 [Candidatus Hodarchaeales archaeon]|jgi:hypothetical protein
MTSNPDLSVTKPFLPVITLIMAVFCWPKSVQLLLGHSYWDPIFFGWRIFFLFCFFLSLILLRRLKHFSNPVKGLTLIVIVCLFIEWHLLYVNLAAMHTYLCRVPPPSTYFPWIQAIIFATIGSASLVITLIHPKYRYEILEIPMNDFSSLDNNTSGTHFLYQIISIPMILGLFHSTFFISAITGSIGCNGIPTYLLGLISLPWIVAACCCFIHQFRRNKIIFFPYLIFFGFLISLAVLMNFSVHFRINFLTGFEFESIDLVIFSLEIIFSFVPISVFMIKKSLPPSA